MSVPEDIDRLERMIEDLKKKYELFFSGMEKKEPLAERTAVERFTRQLQTAFVTNSALIYRLKSVATKLTTYQGYWDRILRQMEEGTFQREIDRRKILQKDMAIAREAERKGEGYISMGEYLGGDLDDEIGKAALEAHDHHEQRKADAHRPDTHKDDGHKAERHVRHMQATEAHEAVRPATPAAGDGMKASKVADLYNAYVTARRTLGERNVNVSLDGFKRQLEKQIPTLREKYKTDQIDFKISIKGGKASIKAVVGNKDEE